MDRVSVICKLSMKWYLMRMRVSRLCRLNRTNVQGILLSNINYALL